MLRYFIFSITSMAIIQAQGPSVGDPRLAVTLMNSGKIREAISEFSKLALAGDSRAMVTIGNLYYEGVGIPQDYTEAMNWWLKALEKNNVDALVNIAVLYRDGKGFPKNVPVAYAIFLVVHMKGLGTHDTQWRNGNNLKKAMDQMSNDQYRHALCFSEEYLDLFIKLKGKVPENQIPKGVPLKNKNWWMKGEVPEFDCPCNTEGKPVNPSQDS